MTTPYGCRCGKRLWWGVVLLLSACGAPPPAKPTLALTEAVKVGDINQVRAHLWHNMDDQREGRIDYAHTILPLAASYGQDEIVTLLLDEGVSITPRQPTYPTPLHYAASKGRASTVTLLLDRGAPVDRTDEYGKTPLIWAAETGQLECVKLLLSAGADPTHRGKFGTAFDAASKNKHADVARMLK